MKNKIIILVILLVLFSAGGYGLYSFLGQEKNKGSNNLVYTNTTHNYSFEYKSEWNLFGTPQDSVVMLYNSEVLPGDGGVPAGILISIIASENYDNLSLEDWVEQIIPEDKVKELLPEGVLSEERFVISGIEGIKITINPILSDLNEGPMISIYFNKDNYIFIINYLGREPDYTNEMKHFENLLKSFKIH